MGSGNFWENMNSLSIFYEPGSQLDAILEYRVEKYLYLTEIYCFEVDIGRVGVAQAQFLIAPIPDYQIFIINPGLF